ncbi:DUF2911 domain-containing protein [uncultured Psychroserpens sp.]|uniref:DUF2911 domain-containing protein n=1 Tax=uncultured Psychroserpens sp. TaxID=255436 RepID=UPI00263005B7|nr:DUF2911 domain-containing protein [uncultured Psychroserpens sp.]
MKKFKILSLVLIVSFSNLAIGQFLDAPPSGNSQRNTVTQRIGSIVEITVDYSSPRVNGRTGKIWNKLVPFDKVWRAGANENTTIRFSHDVQINGNKLNAGVYGLFMIPTENEWTIVFSNNSTSWGSTVYNEKEDALRIKVKAIENHFTEWLTYDFIERMSSHCDLALKWENLLIPFKIEVDIHKIVLESFKRQLNGAIGLFNYEGTLQAAKYCLSNEVYLQQGLDWINQSVTIAANFSNLIVKYQLLEKLGKIEESKSTYDFALSLGTPQELYYYGRKLMREEKLPQALVVFQTNYDKYGSNVWPTDLGMGRIYQAMGKNKKAKKHYEAALKIAKLDRQKRSLEGLIIEVTN